MLPGTHWIHVDKNGIVWGSENWAHNIYRLDPKTGDFKRIPWKVDRADEFADGRQLSRSIRTASSGARATRRSARSMR